MTDAEDTDAHEGPHDREDPVALVHNQANAVTGGIWRVRHGEGTAVRKVLVADDGAPAGPWQASSDPHHWNYWRREALVYQSNLPEQLGLHAPALVSLELGDDRAELVLEDVPGRQGKDLTLDDLVAAAVAIGTAQARLPDVQPSWLSRGFLREYTASKPADYSRFDDDEAWAAPLLRDNWPPSLRPALARLHGDRERFLAVMASLPRAVCHLDFWPNNLIRRPDGEIVLIDWTFVGDGAVGEDIGNLVPDAVFDQLFPSARIDELDRGVFAGYVEGLHAGGWTGDERLVRLGMCASAIKYEWLAPLLVDRVRTDTHFAYGGAELVSIDEQFADRGVGLDLIVRWADEARSLARTLDRLL